eukprot:178489-Karenia_brevis.AAC.1
MNGKKAYKDLGDTERYWSSQYIGVPRARVEDEGPDLLLEGTHGDQAADNQSHDCDAEPGMKEEDEDSYSCETETPASAPPARTPSNSI